MINFLKTHRVWFGQIFTVVVGLFMVGMSSAVYLDAEAYERMQTFLFDCGVDAIGALVAAGLYYGCMRQEGEGTGTFRSLIVFVSFGFFVNLMLYYTMNVPQWHSMIFIFVMLSKLIDLVMIYYFYRYMKQTLGFEGKLAGWADKGIPILMAAECLVILSNIFYPLTFMVDQAGMYQTADASILEDVYLIVASVITTILILRSKRPRNQKVAGLTFIFLPLINYVMAGGTFGNASQYGMILVSLIIMYCIIFNEKSTKLASTQTELNMATQIQASMLPSEFPAFPDREEFDLYASMNPAKEVGGDLYDFFLADDDHLCMVVGDVSGKGVPAALFMVIAKTLLKMQAQICLDPEKVLQKVNAQLAENNKESMFVTVWLGVLQISTGELTYADAGHEKLLMYQDGEWKFMPKQSGPALAMLDMEDLEMMGDVCLFHNQTVQLKPGDAVFQYTDGVTEATDANNELFGDDRLMNAMSCAPTAKPGELLPHVRQKIDEFVKEAEQFDDITMLGMLYKG